MMEVKTQFITITETAIAELKRLKEAQDIPENLNLRVGVKGGGCSGFSYVLGFDEKAEGDSVYEIAGFDVIVNAAHGMYLSGMQIDYVDGLDNRGFIFNNPNAKSTCGCGDSFEA